MRGMIFSMVFSFALLSGGVLKGQASGEGILLVSSNGKYNVWHIRVEGLNGQNSASYLDQRFGDKLGIIEVQTDPQTSICEVKALPEIQKEMLRDVVTLSGYSVSKSF